MALPKVGSHLLAPMHLIFLSILLFLDLKDIMFLRTSAPKHPLLHPQLFTIKQFLIMPLFESEKDKASDCSVPDENKYNIPTHLNIQRNRCSYTTGQIMFPSGKKL